MNLLLILLTGAVGLFGIYFIGACLVAASRECMLPDIEDIEA